MEENDNNKLFLESNNEDNLISRKDIPDECLNLIPSKDKKEKQDLIDILGRLKDELDNNEGNRIIDIYQSYSENETIINL